MLERIRKTLGFGPAPSGQPEQVPLQVSALSASEVYGVRNDPYAGVFLGTMRGNGSGQPIEFSTLFRCITLLTGVSAQLVAGGKLRVVDRFTGNTITTRSSRNALNLLSGRPDGYTPAYSFVEDVMADLLLEGNALVGVSRSGGRPSRLVRLNPITATATKDRNSSTIAYEASERDDTTGALATYTSNNIIHARIGVGKDFARTNRAFFAPPVVQVLRPALAIGIEADKHIQKYYRSGGGGRVGISLERDVSGEQLEELNRFLAEQAKVSGPFVVGQGAKFTAIGESASDADTQRLREFQVAEVARAYGIPAPLVGSDVSAWGSAIESLARNFWKFGMRQHLDRFLYAAAATLLPEGQKFETDGTDILRGDSDAAARLITAIGGDAQRRAYGTPEEVRDIAGLPRQGAPEDTRTLLPDGSTGDTEPDGPEEEAEE